MAADPYSWPGSDCLRNKLGIHDADRLSEIEFRVVAIRDVQVLRATIPGNFGMAHLQAFHRFLFRDIYEWAGRTRTVDISKPGGYFCHWRRAFLRQLSAAAGYELDWSELNDADNIEACRTHLNTADLGMLISVLDPVVRRIT